MIHSLKNPILPFRLSRAGGALAIWTFPISVSSSQLGVALAIIGWIWWSHRLKANPQLAHFSPRAWALPFHFHPFFWIPIALYGWQTLSLLIVATGLTPVRGSEAYELSFFAFLSRGVSTEINDAALMAMAFWVVAYMSDERGRVEIYRWLAIAAAILMVTGFISIFSKFRLSKFPHHLLHGWEASAEARYQHFLFTLPGGVSVYMPIGFLGTHLTYAAMLGFLLPAFLWKFAEQWGEFGFSTLRRPDSIAIALLAIIGSVVLLLNGGRSAILGFLAVVAIGSIFHLQRWQSRQRWRLAALLLAIFALVVGLYVATPSLQHRVERVVSGVFGGKKHTDFQRYFVWQSGYAMVAESPITGVGAGNFEQRAIHHSLRFSEERPGLWYGYATMQRGHAHNDLVHQLAIAGIPGALLYLYLFAALTALILARSHDRRTLYWRFSPLLIFAGGLFQCYFLDAEVLLPFWILTGIVLRDHMDSKANCRLLPRF